MTVTPSGGVQVLGFADWVSGVWVYLVCILIGLTQKKLSNSREFLVDYSTPEVMQAIGSD
jgi:hypothetical protein